MLKERKKNTLKFVKQKRMTTNRAEVTGSAKRDYYVYGSNGKSTYMTVISDTILSVARSEGMRWARENDLQFERVVAFKK